MARPAKVARHANLVDPTLTSDLRFLHHLPHNASVPLYGEASLTQHGIGRVSHGFVDEDLDDDADDGPGGERELLAAFHDLPSADITNALSSTSDLQTQKRSKNVYIHPNTLKHDSDGFLLQVTKTHLATTMKTLSCHIGSLSNCLSTCPVYQTR